MSRSVAATRDGSSSGETKKTVDVAIGANVAIAVAKVAGGLISGSPALLAEAAHSLADTGNQVLLRVSLARGEKEPDESHPFGYGQERFFWALIVAVVMFVLGSIFSVAQGVVALFVGGHDRFAIAYAVLVVALVAESTSLVRALAETRADARREGCSVRAYLRGSTDPTVKTVLFEDGAAVTGVLVATAGVLAHQLTGRPVWEASASILIGCGLAYVAFRLGRTSKDLLVGRPASPSERAAIRERVSSHPAVATVADLRTMHIGPEALFVAVRVAYRDGIDSAAIADASAEIEHEIRQAVPDVSDVYLDSIRAA